MWVAFANAHFLSKNISLYAMLNDQSFNDILTNNMVSFEQLGPDQLEYMHNLIKILGKLISVACLLSWRIL